MDKHLYLKLRALSDRDVGRVLFCCGLFLAASEAYKQLFLYFAVNHRHYDWWFFPFQLCSLPMYLCLALPFLKEGQLKTVCCTFMQDFNLLGGIAALLVPEGFMGIHWSLTLHGFVWHSLLILIGGFVFLTGRSDLTRRGFFRTLPVFAVCCVIATAINIWAPGNGQADMFYISPYYPTTQIIFHDIALRIGIQPANLLYLATVCLGGFVVHHLFLAADNLLRMKR